MRAAEAWVHDASGMAELFAPAGQRWQMFQPALRGGRSRRIRRHPALPYAGGAAALRLLRAMQMCMTMSEWSVTVTTAVHPTLMAAMGVRGVSPTAVAALQVLVSGKSKEGRRRHYGGAG